jgi:hypothetical protein
MTRHVGGTALARYREGDFGSRKSARIRAHLATCARCAALDTDLVGVTALLARAPAPAMPDHVTTRIQAALRAEASRQVPVAAGHQLRQPARSGQSAQSGQPGKRRPSRHAAGRDDAGRRWRLPKLRPQFAVRALGAAAAIAAVAGGFYGIGQLASGGQPTASSGAAGIAAAPQQRSPAAGPPLTYRVAGRPASVTPVSTNTDFRQRQLTSQVRSVLQRSGSKLPAEGPMATNSGSMQTRKSPGARVPSFGGISLSALQGCITRISAGSKVLLVDVDRYQSKRATVIVLAGPGGGTGGAQIFVVGPGCSASDSDLIARESLPGPG